MYIQATIQALNEGETAYVANSGIASLRDAVADAYTAQADVPTHSSNILISTGSMLCVHSLITALVDPGDEVSHPNYPNNLISPPLPLIT